MPYVVIEDFRAGLDKRRLAVTAAPGSLQIFNNAHLSRGAEIEKRKALVDLYDLPAGTFGFEIASGNLYVFGSAVDPGVPVGTTYQRLQHPDGLAMTAIVHTTVFNGKVAALGRFSDGVWLFYDGAAVLDWKNGVARASMVNNSGIATHLAALIDASANYSAAAVGAVITVTGPSTGQAFTVDTSTVDGGGNNDQTLVSAQTQTPIPAVSEALAQGSFRITGGTSNPGTNKVSTVKVNAVTITNAAVNWTASNAQTAALIAASINAKTSAPDYTATSSGDQVTIKAVAGSGSTPNGFSVEVTCAGNVSASTGGFDVTGGTSIPGTNKVNQVRVNGVVVNSGSQDWTTSDSNTASLVATSINGVGTYIARANGRTVNIFPSVVDEATPLALTVTVANGGDVTTGNLLSLQTTVNAMAGGVDALAGTPQKNTLTVGGTFQIGDQFRAALTLAGESQAEIFGADNVAGQVPSFLLTHKNKLYAVAGSIDNFSGIDEPTKWNTDDTGAGNINMSNQAAGSETLTGLGVYENNQAVFARRAIQVWFMDPDPDANSQLQVIANVGTLSGKSITSVGDSDVFFLADSGIRSLQVRDASKNASIGDIGTPIDDIVLADLASLASAITEAAVGTIDPRDGRYWLNVGTKIYVLSYFPAFKISGWSTYDAPAQFSDFKTLDNTLYGRAGDEIYAYGGLDGQTYDSSTVEIEIPYVNAKMIATWKQWQAIDMAVQGEWAVYASSDPENPTVEDLIAIVSSSTFRLQTIPFDNYDPQVKLRLVNTSAGAAKIGNLVIHYEGADTRG